MRAAILVVVFAGVFDMRGSVASGIVAEHHAASLDRIASGRGADIVSRLVALADLTDAHVYVVTRIDDSLARLCTDWLGVACRGEDQR